MSLMTKLVRDVIYPAWLLREGQYGILRRVGEIETTAHLNADQLQERQLHLLRRLLVHAEAETVYYRRLFAEHGFSVQDFRNSHDLRKLPLLTKAIIGKNTQEIIADSFRSRGDLMESHTGGSTGLPMRFYRDTECLLYRRALDHFLDNSIGFHIGDKQALLWGNPFDVPVQQSARHDLLERVVWRRISHLPVVLDDRSFSDFVLRVKDFKPKLFKAYPSLLHFFCNFIVREELGPIKIPMVVATAEQLFDFQRELAQEVLGCQIFEKYGSREIGTAAAECTQHDGLHLITESLYVEVERVPGYENLGVGKLIVTDLRNYAMPLIRYEVGDLAAIDTSPCQCGSPFPRLKNIQGRATDILYRKDGTPIAGLETTDAITYSGISTQAQIVQDEPGSITVKIVQLSQVTEEQRDYIRTRLMEMLGNDGDVTFADVDAIERDKSGKFRYTISNVKM
jgi:phenylacetate-CoA ligase